MPVKKTVAKKTKKNITRKNVARRPVAVKTVHEESPRMVSFGRAVSNFFKKYFQFDGVATRAEYWWMTLFLIVVGVVLLTAALMLQPVNLLLAGVVALFWVLFCLVVVVPTWTLMSRRLHDAGFTAKLLWISFVFFIYSLLVPEIVRGHAVIDWISFMWGLFLCILFLFPSKRQDNPYRD
jgi:uncharacterized membrane protein YhaH (DUF805 family)